MSKLIAASIKESIRIEPAVWEKKRVTFGTLDLSYGLCECSYDIRLSETHMSSMNTVPRGGMRLCTSMEKLWIPNWVEAEVRNKSTLARLGLLQPTTTLEPGWYGHVTLEIMYFGDMDRFTLYPGMPIAQILFSRLDGSANPYEGKYQDQPEEPVLLSK